MLKFCLRFSDSYTIFDLKFFIEFKSGKVYNKDIHILFRDMTYEDIENFCRNPFAFASVFILLGGIGANLFGAQGA